jgi:hypothetical protein
MSASSNQFHHHVAAMEEALSNTAPQDGGKALTQARGQYVEALVAVSAQPSTPKTLSTLVDAVAKTPTGRREAAILTVRALAVEGLLPLEDDAPLSRNVAALIEAGFPDGCKNLKLSDKRMTYEKVNALKGLHASICGNLSILHDLPTSLTEINALNGDIQRALRKDQCGAYLSPFGWTVLRTKVIHICEQIAGLVACSDVSYKSRFDQVSESCRELAGTTQLPNFLNTEYIAPFVSRVESALQTLKSGATDQFACTLETRRRQPDIAEKRYPLHRAGEMLTITVPMTNEGPGVAVDVTVELDCGISSALALDTDELRLGDIPPGEFALSFKAMVDSPMKSVSMAVQVSWNELFGEPKSIAFDLKLVGQDPTVDWAALEQLDPYSLEEADSEQFVGRTAKIQAIGNRLLKAQMSSTYITGQKRVGKTSLAKAVLRYISAVAKPPAVFETTYLEWGEYSTADARSTVKALGDQLYAFLSLHLPQGVSLPTPNFEGSLAPLNAIAKALETYKPNHRFVIVLDEFDEIHPEMYRYGALAEAFFSNLRTLAARRNLAFILVGGEKMPFIIGAQGDQLNKFGREPLDYFSRSDEWNDFVELVTAPAKNRLNWGESALNEVFTLTNGHPYYTNLLCARVFANAIAQRDTEIIARDVRHAASGRISELDTNAFAHFWKDGINAEREAAEVIELKRLRLLVAFGRASRIGATTKDAIAAQVTSSALQVSEVGPLVDDFCRRDIMKESGPDVMVQLSIFYRWLQDVGVTKLISSTLADDLEAQLKNANDLAYVTAKEVESLVKVWPLYRGVQITGETVRAWLEQVDQTQEQRLLFTILTKLRFVTTAQINEQLRVAHERVVAKTPPRTRENKVEKRRDLLVTYLDGPGKSGATYAKAYAKENGLLMESVMEPTRLQRRLASESDLPNGVVIVDDLAGTGRTIADGLAPLVTELGPHLVRRGIPLFVILLYATEDAETRVESSLRAVADLKAQLHIGTILTDDDKAFPSSGIGFWPDEQTRDRAKALCTRLAAGLYKDALGFGSQALLIAFPDTCPNNNLPIIFASRTGSTSWSALLPRPAS